VTLDGCTVHVDVACVDAHLVSLIVTNRSDCQSDRQSDRFAYEVAIAPNAASGALTVTVGTTPVAVTVDGRRNRQRRDDHGAATGPQEIAAPMSGKVVRVLVKPGDAVRARQPLVVVEAMKMENELRAQRDGAVASVHAREGQSVDAGALLVVVQS